ncbi:hypothetical protein RHMOL_Rhmol13G0129000 [Rhododendron molle]|uniref:Uncharacterized protein n=1 Tax=Rhododendron molle TaxID=49168 RepID=A0ACC0L7L1_RHOML|nr:hypothetical protein RHMOL_Rhmol13G0129000 [Rhododendron molle]
MTKTFKTHRRDLPMGKVPSRGHQGPVIGPAGVSAHDTCTRHTWTHYAFNSYSLGHMVGNGNEMLELVCYLCPFIESCYRYPSSDHPYFSCAYIVRLELSTGLV